MTISKCSNLVTHDNSFVVVGRKSYFIYFFAVQLMSVTSDNIHGSILFPPSNKHCLKSPWIMVSFTMFFLIGLPLRFFVFILFEHSERIQLRS